MKGRVVVAMFVLEAAALSACRRSLEGAPCPCVAGWTCCATTGTCVPAEHEPFACPDYPTTGEGGEGGISDEDDASASIGGHAGAGIGGDASAGIGGHAGGGIGGDGGGGSGGIDAGDVRDAGGGDARDANTSDGPSSDSPAPDALPGGTAGDGSADGAGAGGSSGSLPPPDLPQVCTSGGWCWTHPLPTNDRFVQVLGVDVDDTWLIGASGTIVRYAGGKWSTIPSPTDALSSIWASGRNDVWVGGPAGPFHWNGTAWSQTGLATSPGKRAVRALWGCAPNDVWAAGGTITRWNGDSWKFVDLGVPEETWQALWGAACDAIWLGQLDPRTGLGATWRWDGLSWKKLADRSAERLAGTGPEDVWSLSQGTLSHWTGLDESQPGTMRDDDARALGLFSIGRDGVGVMELNRAISLRASVGTTTLPKAAPESVATLWGRTANDVWGAGAGGTAWHWDGFTWKGALPAWSLGNDAATRIIATSATDLWAAVGGALLHGDGRSWETAMSDLETGGGINDLWASGADDIWVATASGHLLRSTNDGWRNEDPWPGSVLGEPIRRISGTGPDDVWIVRGDSSLLHWDGHGWVGRDPYNHAITDVWAAAPGEAWVVGQGLAHWRDGAWQSTPKIPQPLASTTFSAVAGSGSANVWFLAGGSLLQLSADGRELTVLLNSDWQGIALAASPTGDMWAMFRDGAVASRLYRSSDAFAAVLAPAGLNDLATTPDGALWVAGPGGALLRKGP
jgi:hypothetical protein